MYPSYDSLTILSQDGVLYHDKPDSNLYINKYLGDERRKQFPYSNIPTHYSRVGMFKKMTYINQLLDFEQPYVKIGDGFISENFVVKDNSQALLVSSIMQPDKHTEHMTYDKVLEFISKSNSDEEQTYYVYLDGSILIGDRLLPTEEKIYNHIKSQFKKNVKDFREYQRDNSNSTVGCYLRQNPWFLNYIEQSINNIDLSLIDYNVGIGNDPLWIVRANNENITIQGIEVTFVRQDDFRVDIYDIPVNKYTLEQLKYIPKINITKEPRIPLKLNPGVSEQDIQEAKQMVKTLRK